MKTIAWAIVAALFLSLSGNVSSKAVAQSPEPQSAYKLKDVIVTSFGFQGNPAVNRSPLSMALGYTEVEWTFITLLELGFTADEASCLAASYGN